MRNPGQAPENSEDGEPGSHRCQRYIRNGADSEWTESEILHREATLSTNQLVEGKWSLEGLVFRIFLVGPIRIEHSWARKPAAGHRNRFKKIFSS